MKQIVLLFCLAFFLFKGLLFAQDTTAQYGKATYYSDRMQGRRTFTGERYSKIKYTAAHASLPMGTLVKITHVKNNKSVVVRINDKCSNHSKRIIDLSKIAAKEIGLIQDGIASVRLEIILDAHGILPKNSPILVVPSDSLKKN